MYNLMTLSITFGSWTVDAKYIKFAILALVLIGIGAYVIKNPSVKEKEETAKFLTGLSSTILKIVFANVDIEKKDDKIRFHLKDYNEFKHVIAAGVYDDVWEYAQVIMDSMVKDGKLSPIVKKLVTKDKVDSIVDIVIDSASCKDSLTDIYNELTKDLELSDLDIERTMKGIEEIEKTALEEADKYEKEEADIVAGVNDKIVPSNEPIGKDMEANDPDTEEIMEVIEEVQPVVVIDGVQEPSPKVEVKADEETNTTIEGFVNTELDNTKTVDLVDKETNNNG